MGAGKCAGEYYVGRRDDMDYVVKFEVIAFLRAPHRSRRDNEEALHTFSKTNLNRPPHDSTDRSGTCHRDSSPECDAQRRFEQASPTRARADRAKRGKPEQAGQRDNPGHRARRGQDRDQQRECGAYRERDC